MMQVRKPNVNPNFIYQNFKVHKEKNFIFINTKNTVSLSKIKCQSDDKEVVKKPVKKVMLRNPSLMVLI